MTLITSWNQAVLDAWILVFDEVLKRISYDIIADKCEASIVNLSENSQHPLSKYIASRMIGFLAEVYFDSSLFHFLARNKTHPATF